MPQPAGLARRADVNLTAPAWQPETIKLSARCCFHVICHCTFAHQEAIGLIVAKQERLRLIVKNGRVHKDTVAAARNRRAATAA